MNLSFAHHRRQFIFPPPRRVRISFMDARVDAGAPLVNAPNVHMPKALSKYLHNPIELFDFSVHHTTENEF